MEMHSFRKLMKISIHTPTKGATRIPYKTCDHLYNFNPHSHEGSDRGKDNPCYGCTISIHTPTKGATWNNSTHTYTVTAISIHTPTKGATAEAEQGLQWLLYFNPHSHEGSDRALGQMKTNGRLFQSTLPRRERLASMDNNLAVIQFQSTLPRRERRFWDRKNARGNWISIHTPTKGATFCYSDI